MITATLSRGAPAAQLGTSFGRFVQDSAAAGELVVQPRMGFSDLRRMRHGLERTRFAAATTAGTLTIDSYTRLGDHTAAGRALAEGTPLNGYPIVNHPVTHTRALLDGVVDASFPVQVRHGSPRPEKIIRALAAAGLHATEGGPVSYCLPYGRTPLRESVENWARGCELLCRLVGDSGTPHVESFGGCLLGQLCPPGLLVAVSLLEAVFFTQHGVTSVSLSYAQQTDPAQDTEAVRALRRLAAEFLPPGVDWHVVLYTYMGVYPTSARGARRLLETSAELAVRCGAERLIVKTAAEAHRIPTVEENVRALETAAAAAAACRGESTAPHPWEPPDTGVYDEARAFVEAVFGIAEDIGRALPAAFARGYLDIPFCLHPDNAGRSRSYVDHAGRLRWADVGGMPITAHGAPGDRAAMTSARLLSALHGVARTFDQ
jgi:methylaspartate mutase epsilon subunit